MTAVPIIGSTRECLAHDFRLARVLQRSQLVCLGDRVFATPCSSLVARHTRCAAARCHTMTREGCVGALSCDFLAGA